MSDFNDGSGGGQSLGGGGGGSGSGPLRLSPEEIRRRRLETLERISATNRSPTPPTLPRMIPLEEAIQTTAPQPPPPSLPTSMASSSPLPPRPTPRVVTYVDRDDDDAELQAVLALSMSEATRKEEKPVPAVVDVVDDMDETDHELQAALSLSLQQEEDSGGGRAECSNVNVHESSNAPVSDGATVTATSSTTGFGDNGRHSLTNGDGGPYSTGGAGGGTSSAATTSADSMTTAVDLEGLSPAVAECYKSSEPCHILDFHSVMWDSDRTTDNDKQRWLSQGINFRDFDPEGKLQRESAKDSVLADVISNHGPWGLTQAHGGPCGVLASLQAELLRLLLFGARDPLDYPTTLNVQYRKKSDLSNSLMLRGLAMSMALILARAAIAPPAALEDRSNSNSNNNNEGGNTDNNNATDQGNNNANDSSSTSDSTNVVQIVLPIHPHNLAWEDFEPWYGNPANGSQSLTLRTYSITVPNTEDPSSSKRQKTNGSQEEQQSLSSQQQHPQAPVTTAAGPTSQALEDRILRLAHAVTAFLLEKPRGSEAPLQAFRKPGGVVLLVMSLAFSRGTRLVHSDMDDPSARLTSQFGHCGQELLNLLLTGQSVSNVFDNTLTPSGDLVCRGIQARPPVGYLTQLESMRYLEVGGYFKTPRYPIWVVGSTSHFTVMFGDADCLQESQSDILLEKCRRAFKGIDGGEENGFIPTQALGGFLKSLDLDIPDHGVQTLAATIEMHGAGIILWDALWKHTSRLMTGATLEAVLQSTDPQNHSLSGGIISTTNDNDPIPLLLTPFGEVDDDLDRKPSASSMGIGPLESLLEIDEDMKFSSSSGGGAAAAASASPMDVDASPILSDEELARKLQEEWNAELSGVGVSTQSSLTAVRGSPTPSTWSNTANDDMNISGFTLSPNPLIATEAEGTSTTDPPTSGNATSTSATTTSTFSNLSPSHSFAEPNNINMLGASQNHNIASAAATSSSSISTIGGGNLQNLEPHAMEHERYGRTFQLYHYNGLRGGALKPFRVTRLSPEEAVGASISLLGSNPSSAAHNSNGDLEDVIRTKWPSCMINWLGGPPPSID